MTSRTASVGAIAPLASSVEGGVAAFSRVLSAALGAVECVQVGDKAEGSRVLEAAMRQVSTMPRVLVHYVNYGFQRRGCPVDLVSRLARNRASMSGARLITIFHEVYAFGPPWRSSFWLSPVQRHLARRLVRVSDACVTSNEPFAAILRRWVPAGRVHVLPVFSTIGEPEELKPWEERAPRMVIFGSPGVRERAYHRTDEQLSRVVADLEVEEVLDIGASAAVPSSVSGVPVRTLGYLPSADLCRLLVSTRFGFVAYPPHLLGKSSVFAAYEAHGLCTVVGWPKSDRGRAEGQDQRWVPAWSGVEPGARPGAIAESALAHYATHSLARHVALHRALLDPCAS